MTPFSQSPSPRIACQSCQLRRKSLFRPLSKGELQFVSAMKRRHIEVAAGATLIEEGAANVAIYTLYEGWAIRYRMLPNGSRQILDFVLPGDLIGLSTVLIGTIGHAVAALTPVSACVLDAKQLPL